MAEFNIGTFENFIKNGNNPYNKPAQTQVENLQTNNLKIKKDDATNAKPHEVNEVPKLQTYTQEQNDNFVKKATDEYNKIKKNRGLFEKFYDYCRNITGFGQGYKKIEQQIELAKNNQISQNDLEKNIEKYKKSTNNSKHIFGDTLSALASIGTYFGLSNLANKYKARFEVNAFENNPLVLMLRERDKTLTRRSYEFDTELKTSEIHWGSKEYSKLLEKYNKHKWENMFKKLVSSKFISRALIIMPAVILTGAMTKYFVMKINRISSKEFDIENKKNLSKDELKAKKKEIKRAKRKDSFKNFLTGGLNGLMAPITGLFGGFVGAPAYILANSGARYAINNKDISLNGYMDNLKDNAVLNTVLGLTVAIPAFRKANYSSVLNKNLKTVVSKLKDVQLHPSDLLPSAASDIERRLLSSDEVLNIFKTSHIAKPETIESIFKELKDKNILTEENIAAFRNKLTAENITFHDIEYGRAMWGLPEKTRNLAEKIINKHEHLQFVTDITQGNIFATKYIQITNGKHLRKVFGDKIPKELDNYKLDKLIEALRENCPTTRTLEEATQEIQRLLGNSNYKVRKLLGVGTVAETYLAKDKSGKEVVIKILKKGIDNAKIQKDKEAFIKLIKDATDIKENEKDFLIKNIENLAESIGKELDLKHEAEAAKELAKVVKKANVAVPIEAKDGIYIMEKANGISVKTLKEYIHVKSMIKYYEKRASDCTDDFYKQVLAEYKEKLEKIKASSPDFKDFDFTPKDIKKLLYAYQNVLTEQFVKLDKNGKIIHGDIHPGNVFVNIEALQGKGKSRELLTLIDTGNTVNLTKEQSRQALKLTALIKNGNYKDIAKTVTEHSVLPEGMTREAAIQKVEDELKRIFFTPNVRLERMNMDNLLELTDSVQRKFGIMPDSTQLTLYKAKLSANNSYKDLLNSFFNEKYGDIDEDSKVQMATAIIGFTKNITQIKLIEKTKNMWQEMCNLLKMPFKEFWEFVRNKNNLKTNSTEHLIYQFKQGMNKMNIEDMFS